MCDSIRVAYERGRDSARAVAVGDQFVGAFGAADQAGYPYSLGDTIERMAFVTAYLEHLPRPIYSTKDNVITKIGD